MKSLVHYEVAMNDPRKHPIRLTGGVFIQGTDTHYQFWKRPFVTTSLWFLSGFTNIIVHSPECREFNNYFKKNVYHLPKHISVYDSVKTPDVDKLVPEKNIGDITVLTTNFTDKPDKKIDQVVLLPTFSESGWDISMLRFAAHTFLDDVFGMFRDVQKDKIRD